MKSEIHMKYRRREDEIYSDESEEEINVQHVPKHILEKLEA